MAISARPEQHHDHGPGFYALLGSILPDHRERMKLLKE